MKADQDIRGRVALDFNLTRARPNSWAPNEICDGVFIRYYEAAGVEWSGDLTLRYRKVSLTGTFIRPLDSGLSMWATESVVVRDGGARVSFVFGGTPDYVARGLFMEL